MIDLHTHSTFSDGTFTPTELVRLAANRGVKAIALSDHNTVDGLPEFIQAAKTYGVEAVPGVEFTTEYRGVELHILGLFIRPDRYDAVTDLLQQMVKRKEVSNRALVDRLHKAGVVLDYDRIKAGTPRGMVNRALIGAALSLGTNIEIIDTPGYAPHRNDDKLIQLSLDAAALAIPEYPMFDRRELVSSGSTDMGDLSCIMPVIHPNAGGAQGRPHGNNYEIVDPVAACVGSAKLQLGMLLMLLQDEGKLAKEIAAEYQPEFASKEEYLAFMDKLSCSGDRIVYTDDEGSAQVKLV